MRIPARTPAAVAAPALAVLLLAGCTPTVPMTAAPDAKNVACAEVVVQLPDQVAELDQRKTDAQGTSAWGQPTAVQLRCGVPVPDPTSTLTCYTVDGIDWLVNPLEDEVFAFVTYGRDPAVEVVVDSKTVGGLPALTDLAFAVGVIPADRGCVDPVDTLQ